MRNSKDAFDKSIKPFSKKKLKKVSVICDQFSEFGIGAVFEKLEKILKSFFNFRILIFLSNSILKLWFYQWASKVGFPISIESFIQN